MALLVVLVRVSSYCFQEVASRIAPLFAESAIWSSSHSPAPPETCRIKAKPRVPRRATQLIGSIVHGMTCPSSLHQPFAHSYISKRESERSAEPFTLSYRTT
jgi:hypothetical protein